MEAGRGGNAANRLAGLRFDARQCDLQRATLRTRELAEQVEVLAEQVEQTGEGELGLGLDRLRGEDRVTACQRTRSNLRPDRRLADPGLALEHERRRAAVEHVKEPVAGGKIVVATDHPRPASPIDVTSSSGGPGSAAIEAIGAAVDELVSPDHTPGMTRIPGKHRGFPGYLGKSSDIASRQDAPQP